jgi:gamma-glutamyltranspeptidase
VKAGSFVTLGMDIKRPDLAEVLQQVSEKGSAALYKGKYAQEIVDVVSVWPLCIIKVGLSYKCVRVIDNSSVLSPLMSIK